MMEKPPAAISAGTSRFAVTGAETTQVTSVPNDTGEPHFASVSDLDKEIGMGFFCVVWTTRSCAHLQALN